MLKVKKCRYTMEELELIVNNNNLGDVAVYYKPPVGYKEDPTLSTKGNYYSVGLTNKVYLMPPDNNNNPYEVEYVENSKGEFIRCDEFESDPDVSKLSDLSAVLNNYKTTIPSGNFVLYDAQDGSFVESYVLAKNQNNGDVPKHAKRFLSVFYTRNTDNAAQLDLDTAVALINHDTIKNLVIRQLLS